MNLKFNWNLKQIWKQYQEIQNYNNLGWDTENYKKCYDKLNFLKSLFEQFNITSKLNQWRKTICLSSV